MADEERYEWVSYKGVSYRIVSVDEAIKDFARGVYIDKIETYNAGTVENPVTAIDVFYRVSGTYTHKVISAYGDTAEELEELIANILYLSMCGADKELREIWDIVERFRHGGL